MQLEFHSLDFPGRTVLYPHECATKLGCTEQHILDLIEEGRLIAVNIAGGNNLSNRRCLRIPIEGWQRFVAESLTA